MKRKLAVAAALLVTSLVGGPASGVDAADDEYATAVQVLDRSQVGTTEITAAQAMELGEQATGIGPGSHLLMQFDAEPDSVYGCTANFVWASGGKLYLGAAGHCFLPVDAVATHGEAADYDPAATHVEVCVAECTNGGMTGFVITGETVDLGPVAYARQTSTGGDDTEDIGYDFGVVEIPAELHDLVRLEMPVFGGPVSAEGELEAGDITCHYGNAAGLGEVYPTMGRVGTGILEDGGAWFAATPSFQGDSGAALQTCVEGEGGLVGDEAIGALTHLSSLGVAGTTVEQAVAMAREAGLSLQIQLPGADDPGGEPAALDATSVSPASGAASQTVRVTISGTGFAEGATVALAGAKGAAPQVTVVSVSGSSIVADIAIPKKAKAAAWDVVVTNPGGASDTLADAFSVTAAR